MPLIQAVISAATLAIIRDAHHKQYQCISVSDVKLSQISVLQVQDVASMLVLQQSLVTTVRAHFAPQRTYLTFHSILYHQAHFRLPGCICTPPSGHGSLSLMDGGGQAGPVAQPIHKTLLPMSLLDALDGNGWLCRTVALMMRGAAGLSCGS